MADDVINMGCSLLHLTAFPFESMLGRIKKLLRTSNRPLPQVCRRLFEKKTINMHKKVQLPPAYEILKTVGNDIKKIKFKQFIISTTVPDNTILLKDGTIINVEKIIRKTASFALQGQILMKMKEVFNYPCDSSVLEMWEINLECRRKVVNCTLNDIERKMARMTVSFEEDGNSKTFVAPLLH